jgi:uncharacterized membrane protein
MKHQQIKTLTLAALLAALCCVATLVIQIPSPMSGYVNLGDCFVLLSAFLLGPFYGTAAAGIGSMMADILSGYAHYAPGTLVIKGACALAACLIYNAGGKKTLSAILGGFTGECIMVAGYFGYSSMILGRGLAAAASVPGNIVQGVFGLVAGVLLLKIVERCVPEMRRSAA